MIVLAHPWLLLLLPLPLVLRYLLPAHAEPRPALRVPFLARLEAASGVKAAAGSAVRRASKLQRVGVALAWGLIILALARPQWIGDALTKTVPSRDLLLAIDLSSSMSEQDFRGPGGEVLDRLQAVKLVVDDFLSRRQGDRVGLILFGSAAFVQTPFTEDMEACRRLLDEAEIGMAGSQTVLGDAIGLAITVFEKSELEQRMLILLTDGNDTGSKVPPENAARVAADYGITIQTVAVGALDTGRRQKLDEDALRRIAEATGGGYSHASSREQLEQIYARIDAMRTRDAEVLSHRPSSELFHWPLATAFVLSLIFHLVMAARTALAGTGPVDAPAAGTGPVDAPAGT